MLIKLARPLPLGQGLVSQWFSEHPEWYKRFGLAGHNGVDYAVPVGTTVLAMHAGIIEVGSDPPGYGNYVRVVGGQYTTLYAHLERISVAKGQRVSVGTVLGVSGNTGNSTGPHLHVALRVKGMRNPVYGDYIDFVPFRTED